MPSIEYLIKDLKQYHPGKPLLEALASSIQSHLCLFDKIRERNFQTKKRGKYPSFGLTEDVYVNNAIKQYIVTDSKTIYNKSVHRKSSFYEAYERNQSIKLFVDIDFKLSESKEFYDSLKITNHKDIKDTIIKKVTSALNVYIKSENEAIKKIQYIVLDSSTAEKISLHIIYVNIYVKDVYEIKYLFSKLTNRFINDLIKHKILDTSVYCPKNLRLLWNTKKGKNAFLEYLLF